MHWWPRQTPRSGIAGANRVDDVVGDPRLQRRAGPGRDDQVRRVPGLDLVDGDLVVADDLEVDAGSISPSRWTRL